MNTSDRRIARAFFVGGLFLILVLIALFFTAIWVLAAPYQRVYLPLVAGGQPMINSRPMLDVDVSPSDGLLPNGTMTVTVHDVRATSVWVELQVDRDIPEYDQDAVHVANGVWVVTVTIPVECEIRVVRVTTHYSSWVIGPIATEVFGHWIRGPVDG